MDKIQKFLNKLSSKELSIFLLIMEQIKKDYKKVPHIRKLVGKDYMYRVRIGKYRIIFEIKSNSIKIIKISKRDDKTYKDL